MNYKSTVFILQYKKMKKVLLWLFLLLLSAWWSMTYATNTDCWDWLWRIPTTTYASGIVYWCDGNIPIITIYGDDGKWITIKAINEWATTISFSWNDINSYWNMYQWWNSYWFPSVAGPTIIDNSGWAAVSAEWYAPGTYNSGTWIKEAQWDSSDNRNLWWWSWDEKNLNGFWWFDTENFEVINATDRQAMCPEWYHIPSIWEWNALLYLWWKNYDENQWTSLFSSRSLNILNYKTSLGWTWSRFSEDMQIPFVGHRNYDSTAYSGDYADYWSSSPNYNTILAHFFALSPSYLYADTTITARGNGYAVRCFKNEYIRLPENYSLIFDSQGGSEVDTWIAEENTSWTKPDDPTKDGYIFVDWYTSTWYEDVFDFTWTLATWNLTVYAKWWCATWYEDNGTGCFATKNIIIQATATEPGQTIKINKYFGNSQKVDWWDGTTGNVYSLTGHTYNESWVYTITLSLLGSNQRWYFQRGYYINYTSFIPKSGTTVTGVKIIYMPSLADWFGSDSAESVWNYFFNYFNDDGAITSLPTWSFDTSYIRNVWESFFDRFNSNWWLLEKLPEWSFDTSNISWVNDFFFAGFNYNWLLTSLPDWSFSLSWITIAKKRYFFHSFNEGWKLTSLPTWSFNTENIETAGVYFFESFNEEWALTSLPKWSFNISNITKVSSSFFDRFNYSGALESLPAWSFNLSWITKTEGLFFRSFNEKWALLSLPQWSFNTTNITEAGGDFFGDFNKNGALEGLPTWSFNTSNITHADYSFFGNFNENWKLKSLPEWSFDVSNIITLEGWTWFFQNFNHNWAITYLPDSFTISSTWVSEWKGYYNAFNSPNYTLNKKVIDLVDGVTVPLSNKNTFSDNQLWRCGVSAGWLVNPSGACKITYDANGWTGTVIWLYESEATGVEIWLNVSLPTRETYTIEWWYTLPEWWDKIEVIRFPEMDGHTIYAHYKCAEWYVLSEDGQSCEFVSVNFDANWWKFSDNTQIYSVSAEILQKDSYIQKILHTPNLTDEWEYKLWKSTGGNPENCTYENWGYNSGKVEIYGASTGFIQIEWAKKLDVSIKYGWSSYYTPWTIWIWTWEHTDYEPYTTINSGGTIRYLSEFPAYGTFGTDEFTVQWDSISIIQANWSPGYWWYITVSGTGIENVVWYKDDVFGSIPQPIMNGYKFIWWYYLDNGIEKIFNPGKVTLNQIYNVYAKWDKNWSSGWWWGWGGGWGWNSSSSSSTGSDTSNQQSWTGTNNSTGTQNGQTTTWTNINEPESTGNNAEIQTWNQTDTPDQDSQENDTDTSNNNTEWQTNSQWGSTYSEEFQQAYEFAKGNWITTMPTIQKANMEWKLTRIAMAKMLSQYAMNVLWQKPANIVTPKFNDVTDKQNSDYDDGVTLAYQLWIMWQNMPNNNFRPDDEVTRAEFATALSRMLYATSDWIYKSTSEYYTNHMKKLKEEWIITKDDPKMKELRWYVMIMLMRSAK